MSKLVVNPAVSERLRTFVESDVFTTRSGVAKSEYWKYYSRRLHTNVSGRSVTVTGGSGFYVPQPASVVKRLGGKLLRAVQDPSKAAAWLRSRLSSRFATPRLMSYEKAFDAVMGHADVSVPIMSAVTINHRKLAQHPKVFSNAAAVQRHYRGWSGYEASGNVIGHYYYQNVLRGFVDNDRIGTVLEIGAGNGNFPSILFHEWAPMRAILLDLPETLAVAIPYLASLFPAAKMAMPHEIQVEGFPKDFDFAFLTVDQLEFLADDSVDLAINCHSFQEMTHEQIDVYFELVQRACRESGFFFIANRVEKIPSGPDAFSVEQPDPPNRFAEYPWAPGNDILVYEISKLSRLVQLDAISIRLERIRKGGPRPSRHPE